MKKRIVILGSTGSIGVSTLQVLALHRSKFEVLALTAKVNDGLLYEQCMLWRPRYAVLVDEQRAPALREKLADAGVKTEVLTGETSLCDVASLTEADYIMASIVGAAGLLPTLAAVKSGKRILLANKESLVMSGQIFMDAVRDNRAELLPIDSEHNAIFQCLPSTHYESVKKILLTASGGPFLDVPLAKLVKVSPFEACAHPNWQMGQKISVDSATMMNKGLEMIEAHWLFSMAPSRIQIVIHPQSIIHSMVEYTDGSILAQLGYPDMRTAVAYGLAWPERITSGVKSLDLFEIAQLDFRAPDQQRFPCLRLATNVLEIGGGASTILNAANEVAVACFLAEQITFMQIPQIIEETLTKVNSIPINTLEDVLFTDDRARQFAQNYSYKLVS